jgi:hypothetical protein
VGTTGLIFAAIAVAWLAYLVPHFVRRRDDETPAQTDPSDRFSDSIRIVEHGTAPLLDQDLAEIGSYEVSTPLTRRAAINDLRRLERLAAVRRRRVLLALLALLSAVVGVWAVDLVPLWAVLVAAGLVVAFFVISRVSVLMMRRSLDQRHAEISSGGFEVTVFLNRATVAAEPTAPVVVNKTARGGAPLWDPVPITMPTYVSKPLAPRTVRTIDLSGPPIAVAAGVQPPVTADAPTPEVDAPAAPSTEAETDEGNGLRKSATA